MAVALFDSRTPLAPLQDELRAAISDVLDGGAFVLGPNVARFEEELAAYLGSSHAIGVANGTEAITIALRALDVGPGDEVVVPSFSFYASAEAIPPTGATPVFCDVDPDTMCVTVESVRAAVTPQTKAIVAVHLFGNVAPVRELEAELGLPVVEDAAQSAGSVGPDGTRPGALGALATTSFYPSKNLGAFGDGGAISTNDPGLDTRVRTLRFHGSEDKVTYDEVGYNSRLDELQAAILRVQLPHLDAWAEHRRAVGGWYAEALEGLPVRLQVPTDGARPAWHLMVLRAKDPEAIREALAAEEIQSRGYYRTPIHAQPAMRAWAPAADALPATDELARTHLAVPMSAALTREQVEEVAGAVRGALVA